MKKELSKEKIEEYIKEHIDSAILSKDDNYPYARYHHNTTYDLAPSIIKHGFLSILAQQKSGISKYTDDIVKKAMIDDFHVNSNDGISFAVTDLKDLYPGEDEYDPMSSTGVDFIVDIPWTLIRNTENYGNEYISLTSVDSKYIRYLDLRIKELIMNQLEIMDYDGAVKRYNSIIRISQAINEYNKSIILRELSNNQELHLNPETIGHYTMIKIKK